MGGGVVKVRILYDFIGFVKIKGSYKCHVHVKALSCMEKLFVKESQSFPSKTHYLYQLRFFNVNK